MIQKYFSIKFIQDQSRPFFLVNLIVFFVFEVCFIPVTYLIRANCLFGFDCFGSIIWAHCFALAFGNIAVLTFLFQFHLFFNVFSLLLKFYLFVDAHEFLKV